MSYDSMDRILERYGRKRKRKNRSTLDVLREREGA